MGNMGVKAAFDASQNGKVLAPDTPAIGLEPVVKLGIDGTIECK